MNIFDTWIVTLYISLLSRSKNTYKVYLLGEGLALPIMHKHKKITPKYMLHRSSIHDRPSDSHAQRQIT